MPPGFNTGRFSFLDPFLALKIFLIDNKLHNSGLRNYLKISLEIPEPFENRARIQGQLLVEKPLVLISKPHLKRARIQ